MITRNTLVEIGSFNKTHGINGEISATLLIESSEIEQLSCIVLDIDGIFVPFFPNAYREKSSTTTLLKLDGVTNEIEAKPFIGKTIYALNEEICDDDDDDDECAAANFIGYTIIDNDNSEIGEIIDIDDSTENYLFVVSHNDSNILIPIADDYVTYIDNDKKVLGMQLPEGLLNM